MAEHIIRTFNTKCDWNANIVWVQEQAEQNTRDMQIFRDNYRCDKYYTDGSTGEVCYRFVKQCCMEEDDEKRNYITW